MKKLCVLFSFLAIGSQISANSFIDRVKDELRVKIEEIRRKEDAFGRILGEGISKTSREISRIFSDTSSTRAELRILQAPPSFQTIAFFKEAETNGNVSDGILSREFKNIATITAMTLVNTELGL